MSVIPPSQLNQLAAHAPFDRMVRMHLLWMLERLQPAYYEKNEVIIEPEQGPVQRFYIIKQGVVQGEPQDSIGVAIVELHEGESFPVGALLELSREFVLNKKTGWFLLLRPDDVSTF